VRPLAAAILTGGRATRMGGADKGALPIDGTPILDRQLAVLREIAWPVFLVGRAPTRPLPPGIRVVPDAIPNAGALGGIYTAIVESPCDRTLVVGCDMPFLSATLVMRLAEEEEADLVIPRSARGYEPLCAVYGKACAPGIRNRIAHGELQASVLPRDVRIAELGPEALAAYDPDGLLFVNVNTPHDYARANGSRNRITND
jgi:molybdopterin-guanine dinucleotide biosynthesis protein A